MDNWKDHKAFFRFYEELNDFLPPEKRKVRFGYSFFLNPSVKDLIESLGVPHSEVEMILVNGLSVGFDYNVQDKDDISVYPVFESFDVSHIACVRGRALRENRFILDVHLGTLCKYLRMMGFDTLYRNDYQDELIARIAVKEKRVILTRDVGLLKRKEVTHGIWIRKRKSREQLIEVILRLDLFDQVTPFTRCLICNGLLEQVSLRDVVGKVPESVSMNYNEFSKCIECGRVYWKGSHYDRMKRFLDSLKRDVKECD